MMAYLPWILQELNDSRETRCTIAKLPWYLEDSHGL